MRDASDMLRRLAVRAGKAILTVRDEGFAVESKADASPVTRADALAEDIILAGLREAIARGELPNAPIVAEEAVAETIAAGRTPEEPGDRLWLVDPLDGTREFVNGSDDFTVNIALVERGVPVAGVVHLPATGETFWAWRAQGWTERDGVVRPLACGSRLSAAGIAEGGRAPLRVLASRSHRTRETDAWIGRLRAACGPCEIVACGSSLKFCRIAQGAADLYPRFGPTMQWDTAAGDAVLRAAGGMTFGPNGLPLTYAGGAGLANPDFVASATDRPPPDLPLFGAIG